MGSGSDIAFMKADHRQAISLQCWAVAVNLASASAAGLLCGKRKRRAEELCSCIPQMFANEFLICVK